MKVIPIILTRGIIKGDAAKHDVGYSVIETEEQAEWANERFVKPVRLFIVDENAEINGKMISGGGAIYCHKDDCYYKAIATNISAGELPLIKNNDLEYLCKLLTHDKDDVNIEMEEAYSYDVNTKLTTVVGLVLKRTDGYISIIKENMDGKCEKCRFKGTPQSFCNERQKDYDPCFLPISTLEQYFDNHSDCYADTWEKDRLGNMVEGKVVPAMTKEAAIKFTLQFSEDFKTQYYEDKLEILIRQINSMGKEITELKNKK